MEVGGSVFHSMAISMEVSGNRLTSMEVNGNFPGSTWKFHLSVEVWGSYVSINCSFPEYVPWKFPRASKYSLHAFTYVHEYHKLLVASTKLTLTLTLTISLN